MKTILVPTDFSANAENALNFAIELAKKEDTKIILLNVYETNYESGAVSYNIIADERTTLERESQKKLQEVGFKIELSGKIKYECISTEGFITDVILDLINKKEIDLVVMGTKGATGFSGAVFGSNSSKVIERAKCPVIAVPEKALFKGIQKITYATDYHHSDLRCLKKIIEIAEPFNAQINILHISNDKQSLESEKEMMKTFIKEMKSKTSYNNLAFQILTGENIEDILEEYLADDATDLLVMSTHHRDLFDKIFGHSITKHMAYHTKIPLMAFHYNIKSSVQIF